MKKKNIAIEAKKALNEFKIEISSELGIDYETDNIHSIIMDVYKNRTSYKQNNS